MLLAIPNKQRTRRVLQRVLDEEEFLCPYGIRSLSRYHKDNPYVFATEEAGSHKVLPYTLSFGFFFWVPE